ncbi:MAG: hypothetical protein KJZ80_11110 [Hyphomicrobiaceae bacterium]|nr:hypothetical protein [Hyphomicrobiaceae bacterium]
MPGLESIHLVFFLLWALIATVAMTAILEGSQGLGLSRLSLPFLIGTMLSSDRRKALVLGFVIYTIGGWLFAFIYIAIFLSVSIFTWWFGMLVGILHGVILLVWALPLLPYVHPRLASDYNGVTSQRQLEPPGFLALNYGRRTPLTTLIGQAVYGTTLGGFIQLHQTAF